MHTTNNAWKKSITKKQEMDQKTNFQIKRKILQKSNSSHGNTKDQFDSETKQKSNKGQVNHSRTLKAKQPTATKQLSICKYFGKFELYVSIVLIIILSMSISQNVNERRIHDEALKETIIESLRDEIAREITNESILEEEDEAIDERFGDEALYEILNEWDEDEQVKIEINDFFHPPIIEVVDIECDESCPKIYEMEDAHASIGYWARDKFIFY